MSDKAKSFQEAAMECAANITADNKQYIQLYMDYSNHHFEDIHSHPNTISLRMVTLYLKTT